jgi:mRNA interferase RelE/StbE
LRAEPSPTLPDALRWRIVIKTGAAKELEALGNKTDRRKLVQRIEQLAFDPRPPGCEKLSGQLDLYRLRSGNYRVVYEILESFVQVTVVKVGHRKDIYRKL